MVDQAPGTGEVIRNAANVVVLRGILRADGTLELAEKPPLPAGPVEVVLRPAAPTLLEAMAQIRQNQQARGYTGRTLEELHADEDARRAEEEEEEERWRQVHAQTRNPLPPG
jgi:hypothetical protein